MTAESPDATVYHFLPANAIGGISNQTLSVGQRLEGRGFENVVVTPDETGPLPDRAEELGLEVRQWPYSLPLHLDTVRSLAWNLRWIAALVPSVHRLRWRLSNLDVDIVHVNGVLLLKPAIAAWLEDIDVVWYLVSDDIYPDWLVRLLAPIVRRIATETVVISDSNREFYRQPAGETAIIPGAIDVDGIQNTDPEPGTVRAVRDRYGIRANQPVIATLGKVHPMKGQGYAIEALARLDRDCHYLVVGPKQDAEYVRRLERLAAQYGLEDRVHVTGFLDDKATVLELMDVYVLPSIGEGTPLSIMEALAAETPVVASDVGGVSELLVGGDAGTLVDKESPAALATAVRKYLDDPELADRHAATGAAHVDERYSIDGVASAYASLYARCLD
jgi:glycosyltransferase involved in cell wall biosynthesis